MKIHFFQRYHTKENVDTANAMLLLSRVYTYSSSMFYDFLRKILPENASVELFFSLQTKSRDSVPDAAITQASFKVVVETKLNGDFSFRQLLHHLESFTDEKYKVLLTLDPKPLGDEFSHELANVLSNFNVSRSSNIIHQHMTFEDLIKAVQEVVNENDYEIQDVLNDYSEYCYSSKLIQDDWKRMRVQLAGKTIEINKKLNLYYDNVERGFSGHKYLGLYNQKAVRAIGEISAIITAIPLNGKLEIKIEKGALPNDYEQRIKDAIEDAKNYGYDLSVWTRYFFVDKFHETLFEKITPYPPRGTRVFDLCEVLGLAELPNIEAISKLLNEKKW